MRLQTYDSPPASEQRLPDADDLTGTWSSGLQAKFNRLLTKAPAEQRQHDRLPATAPPVAPAASPDSAQGLGWAVAPPAPETASDSRAQALAEIQGRDIHDPAVLRGARQRVQAVADPVSAAGLEELRQHLPLLEALFLGLLADSASARRTDDRVRLTRAALQAKQAHDRAFALLRAMSLQVPGQVGVTIHDDA